MRCKRGRFNTTMFELTEAAIANVQKSEHLSR